MALTHEQQAYEYITRAARILIVTRESANVETIAAAAACFGFLKQIGKETDVVIPGYTGDAPTFLPFRENLRPRVGAMRALHLLLDVSHTPLEELLYTKREGKLDITLLPKSGEWTTADVHVEAGADRYDLVIAIDAPDLVSLGEFSKTQADFLYRTPVIVIDHSVQNEHWGQMNLVDLTAVSTTEVLYTLFEKWNRHLINEAIATAILTGMVAATQSFRTTNVTPKTLTIASQLLSQGARRQDIIHGLWRTRSVTTLNIWGRLLSRLKHDRDTGLVWSILTRQDLAEAGEADSAIDDVIPELIQYAPDAKIIALFTESRDGTALELSLHAQPPYRAHDLARLFGGTGTPTHATARITHEGAVLQTGKQTIERIREQLRQK